MEHKLLLGPNGLNTGHRGWNLSRELPDERAVGKELKH